MLGTKSEQLLKRMTKNMLYVLTICYFKKCVFIRDSMLLSLTASCKDLHTCIYSKRLLLEHSP